MTEPRPQRPAPGPPRPGPGPVPTPPRSQGAPPGDAGPVDAGPVDAGFEDARPQPGGAAGAERGTRFADLAERPVADHVAVFDAEHARLQRELGTIDQL